MRIGVLTSLYPSRPFPFEGIFAERRWDGMRERGHDVRVVHPFPRTPGPFAWGRWAALHAVPPRERRGEVWVEQPRYLHLPRRAHGNARRFAAVGVRRLLAGGRPEVVVADYAWPAAAAAPLLAREGIACVVSGRGSDVLQVAGEAGLAAELAGYLRAAGHWCAVSEDLLAAMDRLGGGRGTLTPNGVDLELFRPGDRSAARAELERADDGPLVLVVGHLIERKDPALALRAFARAAPAGARLVLLGRGPLEDALREEARVLGLDGRVELVGEQPPGRLADWYRAADCLLLTSRREGRPNVVLEALASGCPVVATDAGGTGELLRGLDGALVRSRDAERVGAALAETLARPREPDRLRAIVEPLSWERSFRALEGCLERAVGSPSPAPSATRG